MLKDEIRNSVGCMRKQLEQSEYILLNDKVFRILTGNSKILDLINSRPVFIYCSLNNETATESIAEFFRNRGNIVAYPKVEDKINKTMEFYSVKDLCELKKGYMGILEPVSDIDKLQYADEAVMIVPMVGFDEKLNRVGYGGGFYDRYILKNKPYLKIGIAFEFQKFIIDDINNYDIKMDYIITENKVYGGL